MIRYYKDTHHWGVPLFPHFHMVIASRKAIDHQTMTYGEEAL